MAGEAVHISNVKCDFSLLIASSFNFSISCQMHLNLIQVYNGSFVSCSESNTHVHTMEIPQASKRKIYTWERP